VGALTLSYLSAAEVGRNKFNVMDALTLSYLSAAVVGRNKFNVMGAFSD
jgi:hypothetical protein